MAMSMEKLEIIELILAAQRAGNDRVDFQQISILEKQTAMGTLPPLSFEQQRHPFVDLRMLTHPRTPINPIRIKR